MDGSWYRKLECEIRHGTYPGTDRKEKKRKETDENGIEEKEKGMITEDICRGR